jgi:phospholipid transport system transporter-binding protein
LKDLRGHSAAFESPVDGRARVVGPLDFCTVTRLLPQGSAAITSGRASVIDLAGVSASDSSGLALLIEWLSVAKDAGHALRYENMPSQLHQLALLSDVDGLFAAA